MSHSERGKNGRVHDTVCPARTQETNITKDGARKSIGPRSRCIEYVVIFKKSRYINNPMLPIMPAAYQRRRTIWRAYHTYSRMLHLQISYLHWIYHERGSLAIVRDVSYTQYYLQEKTNINNSIRASELRVIDAEGGNLGILSKEEALARAKEKGLDLIEISPNAKPPVAKIMDYGKYRYQQEKKGRESKKSHQVQVREVQVGLNTSQHDLEMKARKASEFLKGGDRVRVEIRLRGRAKYLDKEFLHQRLKRVLDFVAEEYTIVEGPLKSPRGFYLLIERKK